MVAETESAVASEAPSVQQLWFGRVAEAAAGLAMD